MNTAEDVEDTAAGGGPGQRVLAEPGRTVVRADASVRPALRRPLGFSQLRRAIGGIQGVALLTAVVPVMPATASAVVIAIALGLLVASFGRDVMG